MTMQYGDSTSETFASGPVGKDRATLAGLSVSDQKFAAIDNTTNPIVSFGNAGIFGLGFPGERSADSFLDTFFFRLMNPFKCRTTSPCQSAGTRIEFILHNLI